jgi:hypothetical protein
MHSIDTCLFEGRPAVRFANDIIAVTVLTGGGHIASIEPAAGGVNPLWVPGWPTVDPSLRTVVDPAIYGEGMEGMLLSSIGGHSLCLDVFGSHSEGETRSGLTFHGEAGMVTWDAVEGKSDDTSVTLVMAARLPRTAIDVTRRFTLSRGEAVVRVEETMVNRVGFERAMGRSQHATIGAAFLEPSPALFACNADRGQTWPTRDETDSFFALDAAFDYPMVPLEAGGETDWRRYPREPKSADLCTLRIRPEDDRGWFVCAQNDHRSALVYAWERAAFPWLMTWEENRTRAVPPWNGKELTRGMEFTSYAFATSRRSNVEMGHLHDTPTFEWLDAYETSTTTFSFGLFEYDGDFDEAPVLEKTADGRLGAHDWVI